MAPGQGCEGAVTREILPAALGMLPCLAWWAAGFRPVLGCLWQSGPAGQEDRSAGAAEGTASPPASEISEYVSRLHIPPETPRPPDPALFCLSWAPRAFLLVSEEKQVSLVCTCRVRIFCTLAQSKHASREEVRGRGLGLRKEVGGYPGPGLPPSSSGLRAAVGGAGHTSVSCISGLLPPGVGGQPGVLRVPGPARWQASGFVCAPLSPLSNGNNSSSLPRASRGKGRRFCQSALNTLLDGQHGDC